MPLSQIVRCRHCRNNIIKGTSAVWICGRCGRLLHRNDMVPFLNLWLNGWGPWILVACLLALIAGAML